MAELKLSMTSCFIDDDILSTLPDEILLQILLKLPTEALIQLISVSKQFNSLICNPEFVEAHLSSVQPHPKHLLSCGRKEALISNSHNYIRSNRSWNFIPFTKSTRWIIGAARGVVCLGDRGVVCLAGYGDQNDADVLLWNPSIQKSKLLPKPVQSDSIVSVMCYGFGFDHVNVDFKVVLLCYYPADKTGEVMVYGVKSRCWKIVSTNVPCLPELHRYQEPLDLCESPPVCVNGVVYWFASMLHQYRPLRCCIMGFDLVHEVCKVVEYPPSIPTTKLSYSTMHNVKLSTSSDGKSLVLFFGGFRDRINKQMDSRNWSVWYLGNDSNWEKRFSVVDHSCFTPNSIVNDNVFLAYAESKKLYLQGHSTATVVANTMRSENWYQWFISEPVIHVDYTPSLALLLN